MRRLVAFLGGVILVAGLFVLLAMLVAPPEDTPTLEMPSLSMAMVEAPSQQSASEAPPPAPSAPAPAPPPPAPAPSPQVQSTIELPEPELPAMSQTAVPTDMSLPPLEEQPPEPAPTPAPTPEPVPEPAPEPVASTAPAEDTANPAEESSASGEGANSEATQATGQQAITAAPQPIYREDPVYPSRARRRGLEGHVVVVFTIRPDGGVERGSITVVESEPARVFDRAVTRAIAAWEFSATGASRRVRQSLDFELR